MDLQQAEEAEGYICPLCEAGAGPAEAEGLHLHLSSSNSTGYKNVFKEPSGRFEANHRVEGRNVGLGIFDTAVEAAVAYARTAGQAGGEAGPSAPAEGEPPAAYEPPTPAVGGGGGSGRG